MPKTECPTMQVDIHEACVRLSRLVEAARQGETVVIADRGKPVARLVATESDEPEMPNGARLLERLERNPLPAHLQRDHDDIEASIQAERDSWERSTSTAASS